MIESITARELQAELNSPKPPRLLDVREPEEFELARIEGSTLIPLGQIPVRSAEIEAWQNDPIVVLCHHGIRSQHAIQFLQHLGFKDLRNLTGGIDSWSRDADRTVPRY
jgi:rhodanese-related sulfurtransferase